MTPSRRTALVGLLVGMGLLTAAILSGVLGTVFFAVTVAYVLEQPYVWMRERGLSSWWASAIATVCAFLAVLAVIVPFAIVFYQRRAAIIALLNELPSAVVLEFAGFVYAIDTSEATSLLARELSRFAVGFARSTPALAAKATVFGFVVFALLLRRSQLRRTFLDPVPTEYRDIGIALHERTRSTLRALYVLQATTSMATFIVALPTFYLLGYDFPVTLAVLAGILQFVPVIGPSVLVLALVGFELWTGAFLNAVTVLVVGLTVVAFLPDAVIRPRLARQSARLPASLYFVGFVGGVFSLGAIGIIAGPLAVALLAELFGLFAADVGAAEPAE